MKEVKSPKRPLLFYYLIVLGIILLFNMLVMPLLSQSQIVNAEIKMQENAEEIL